MKDRGIRSFADQIRGLPQYVKSSLLVGLLNSGSILVD